MTVSSATSDPVMRPVLARTNSAASGLRFCGMIELPVVKASDNRMKPYGALHQITTSSAKRDTMHRSNRRRRQIFEREIAVRYRVQRIRRGPVEVQALPRSCRGRSENACAGQSRAAERRFIEPAAAHPPAVRDRATAFPRKPAR